MKKTVSQIVLDTLSGDGWWAPHEIRMQLQLQGHYISESNCTARMRELRSERFGRWDVRRQYRKGTGYYEYKVAGRIEVSTQKAA